MNEIAPWAPDVLRRIRQRYATASGVERWMARNTSDREFARWVYCTLCAPLSSIEELVCAALVMRRPPEDLVVIDAVELDRLRRQVPHEVG